MFSVVRDLLRERNKGRKEGRVRAVGNSFFSPSLISNGDCSIGHQ